MGVAMPHLAQRMRVIRFGYQLWKQLETQWRSPT
eukprot:COSAG01_NODE_39222_length_479_cov_1.202632_1_plen_33_part_01